MDEAQDDVDKAAAATAANEEADDAAEFGDDIREKEPGDDLDEDDTKGGSNPGSKPGSAADLRRLGGAPRDGDLPFAEGALALETRGGSPPRRRRRTTRTARCR